MLARRELHGASTRFTTRGELPAQHLDGAQAANYPDLIKHLQSRYAIGQP